ncbi:MAG TPA: acyl-CoA dehydrogenase family protein [Nocardia sp.]|nr:acyl-CoA dehydrogenase family protein [Nocardia sp.]HLS77424.1 acyl-CoA dehydrogenase family protein [Nocardia sp.]
MDFTRDEGQDAVAEVVVGLLEREQARDFGLWPGLVETGLLGLALPERFGGDGMGLPEISVLLTELGTDAVAVPALPTLGLGLLPLLPLLPDAVAEVVYPEIARGAILTAALSEPGDPFTTSPKTTAVADGDVVRVSGHKIAVPYADEARWLLIPTDAGVALVDGDAPGLTRTASPSSGGLPESTVRLDGVEIPAERLLPADLTDLHRYAIAAIGAAADGLLEGALRITAEHLRTRRQFNRPLAEFQAVAQQVADLYVVSRTLHAVAASANWALAQLATTPAEEITDEQRARVDDDLDVLAYTVTAELPAAMQKCHHLHGGLGVDVTHPMHRYYSQAKDLVRWLGGESLRLDRLGARCSSI